MTRLNRSVSPDVSLLDRLDSESPISKNRQRPRSNSPPLQILMRNKETQRISSGGALLLSAGDNMQPQLSFSNQKPAESAQEMAVVGIEEKDSICLNKTPSFGRNLRNPFSREKGKAPNNLSKEKVSANASQKENVPKKNSIDSSKNKTETAGDSKEDKKFITRNKEREARFDSRWFQVSDDIFEEEEPVSKKMEKLNQNHAFKECFMADHKSKPTDPLKPEAFISTLGFLKSKSRPFSDSKPPSACQSLKSFQ